METSAKATAQRLTDPAWGSNRVRNPLKAMAAYLRRADEEPFASAEYIRYSQRAYDVGVEALKDMDPDSEDFARVSKAVTDIAAYLAIDWGDGGTGDLSQIMTSMVASGDCGCSYAGVTAPETPEKIDLPEGGERYAYWEGPIGFEGQLTGDGRYIEHGALRWSVPQPIRYVSSDVGAHDGAVVVGAIQNIERREGGVIWGSGMIDLTVTGGPEAYYQVSEGYANGVSMDLDDVSFEVRVAQEVVDEMTAMFEEDSEPPEFEVAEDGRVIVADMKPDDEVSVTKDARIRAATIVAIPAFADARITITASGFFAYNPSQARAPKGTSIGGQWIDTPTGILSGLGGGGGGSSSGGGSAPASGDSGGLSKIVTIVREQGGASLDPITLAQPTDGYMVAIQGHNVEVPEDDFFAPGVGEDALYDWIENNIETLREPGAHIGLWHDTAHGEVVLDVSQRVDTLEDALLLGQERNQQAIWDVANGVEIPTGGTGDRGAEQHAVRGSRFSRASGRVRDVGQGAQARVHPGSDRGTVSGIFVSDRVETFLYNPEQARAPKGTSIGGQWIDTPTGLLDFVKSVTSRKAGPPPPALAGDHSDLAPDAVDPDGRPYGADVVRAANSTHADASRAEPQVTLDIQNAIARTPGADELVGLEYRVKEQASLAKKIRGDMEADGISVQEAANGVFDSIRYTATSPMETHAQDVQDMLADLDAAGYERVQVKNFWLNEDMAYKGINVKLRSPEGVAIELQFHTPESYAAKTAPQMHGIYDKQKLVPKGSNEFWGYEEDMKAYMVSLGVKTPDGIDSI